jgi:hypothetical protein
MKKLPSNIWASGAIRLRLEQEARFESAHGLPCKPQYWVSVPNVDSTYQSATLRNFVPDLMNCDPHEMQIMFAEQIRKELQRMLHHDGVWVVGWTHPPQSWENIATDGDNCWGRMIILWLDEDGDPQMVQEFDNYFAVMLSYGEDYYVDQSEKAWLMYDYHFGKKAMKNDLGIHESQMTKEALETLV